MARSLEGVASNEPKRGETSDEKRALTKADLATQEILLAALGSHHPEVQLAAEEETPSVGRFPAQSDDVVVIDPIDGTLRSYLEAQGPYAIMVGLVRRGEYRAGLVALPREGLFFDAAAGRGAWRTRVEGVPRPATLGTGAGQILVSHGTPPEVVHALEEEDLSVRHGCGGAVSVAPLIPGIRAGLRWVPAAHGISVRGRVGALIAREASAVVAQASGSDFPRDMDTPAHSLLVTRSQEDREILSRAMARAGIL